MSAAPTDFGNFGDEYVALLEERDHLRARVEQLERETTTDPLTGLLNLRGFEAAFKRSVQRAARYRKDRSVSVIMVDADYFKRVNDAYGHKAGDDVLRTLGTMFREHARITDAPARIGGDEFVVLVEGPLCQAESLANRMHRAVNQFQWVFAADIGQFSSPAVESVTVSCGVAQRLPDETLGQVLERADIALYRAKGEGRNRVRLAG